jgi:hypothetical protein
MLDVLFVEPFGPDRPVVDSTPDLGSEESSPLVARPVRQLICAPRAIIMAERHLTVRRQVAASCDSVWDVFADFPNLAVGTLVETVTAWEEAAKSPPRISHPLSSRSSRPSPCSPSSPMGTGQRSHSTIGMCQGGGPVGRLTGPAIDTMLRRDFESMLASIEDAALNVGDST